MRYYIVTHRDHLTHLSEPPAYMGQVLTDTQYSPNGFVQTRRTAWSGSEVYEGTVPLDAHAGTRLGYLIVGLSTGGVDAVPGQVVSAALCPVALAVLATMALTYAVARRATRNLSSAN